MQQFSGTYTALITPFHQDGTLDEKGFCDNLKAQVQGGVDGVVVLGTTGESPALPDDERQRLVELAVDHAGDHLDICVGVGCNNTESTIERARWAQNLGAHSLLVITPYYNKPTQRGIYSHFEALSRATDLPILLYNHPGRTGTNIETLTMMQIAELPNIAGVKQASDDLTQTADIIHHAHDLDKPFHLMSGDDILTLPTMALGGTGVISVLSNLAPAPVVQMVEALQDRDLLLARELYFRLLPLCKALTFETNPIPIKEAMSHRGLPAGPCRLPLSPMSEPHAAALHQLLHDAGLSPAGARQ